MNEILEAHKATREALLKRKYYLEFRVDPLVSNPFRWSELNEERRQQILDYRQALLDITKQSNFPYDIEWPDY